MKADYTDFHHTGPGTLAGRYMRRFWQPVYVAADLPPGHARPIRVMSEDCTLYRGEGGTVHLLDFRCAHRGTQLSTGWVEGDCIRCFYHGWKYDGAGQCVEQPAEEASFARKVQIRSYPTEEYLGLVFAYLGEAEGDDTEALRPPPLPRYRELEQEGVLDVSTYTRLCNYFNNLENGPDPVHLAFVHRASGFTDNGLVGVPRVEAEESDWGLTVRATRPGGGVRVTQFGLPNLGHIKSSPDYPGGPWQDALSWRVPVDDDHHRSFNANLTHVTGEAAAQYRERRRARPTGTGPSVAELAAAVLRGDLRIDDLKDHPGIVGVQDTVAQVGQGVIADHEHERLGRSDAGVILLRKLWARELQALAEGRPLKQWTWEGAGATSGV